MIGAISSSFGSLVLFADTVRTRFSWDRIDKNTDWILPVVVLVIAAFFVRKWYERDARELGRGIGWFLTIMRTLVFVGLFVIYLQPTWRTETERKIESRVAILADTSLSMGLTDPADGTTDSNAETTRAARIAKLFDKSELLNRLRETHHVDIYTFGDSLKPLTTLKKFPEEGEESQAKPKENQDQEGSEEVSEATEKSIDWNQVLKPMATETRLGDSMTQLIDEIRDAPVAGIIMATDGGYNMGVDPVATLDMATESKIKLFPIGVGSDVMPPNVRVSQFVVPPRIQLKDEYTVTGYIQARGMKDKMAKVQLFMKKEGTKDKPTLQKERDVQLMADGETIPVPFKLTPSDIGHYTFSLQVVIPKKDEDRYPADNIAEAQCEIVDRPLRVLLFAGGPMREFQFIRNLLYRDEGVEVDVLLQSALAGISQDANKVLDVFPETIEEISNYDCIIAFDPDWRELSEQQMEILERWVSKLSGGMILFVGAVNAGETLSGWIQEPRTEPIQWLYPVLFQKRYMADEGHKASADPFPPAFTREGKEADFLSLSDDPVENRELWKEFEGVYAYLPVEGPKDGATVYARFSTDETASDQRTNVYFAGQFYGSGRTFYAGSAELWRLRRLDEKYYERLVTKLLRHVTQGRLLNGSKRGMLMIEEQYLPGDTIEIRAQLNDAKIDPLTIDKVLVDVTLPDGSMEQVFMRPEDQRRPGKYVGRLPVTAEGNYKMAVVMPDDESVQIERRFQVKMPDRERENPVRNDPLLSHLANATGGQYYFDADVASGSGMDSLIAQLPNRTKTIVLTSTPDIEWERQWLMWMMFLLIGLLAIEWTIRRLLKLA